jgi:hypothetical protein
MRIHQKLDISPSLLVIGVNRRLPNRQGAIPRLMAIRTDHNLSAVLERAQHCPITLASMTLKRENRANLPQDRHS